VESALEAAAGVPLILSLVVFVVALGRAPASGRRAPDELASGIALALEFLLAAGLLRLSAIDDFGALAGVAAIVVLRKVIATGIRSAARAVGRTRTT
jgi:uncharacterized membrane protein